jgi:hypothetical protein
LKVRSNVLDTKMVACRHEQKILTKTHSDYLTVLTQLTNDKMKKMRVAQSAM